MTKWEYCAIRSNIEDDRNFLKHFTADSDEGKVSEVEDVHQTTAQLGTEGWELVTLQQISDPDARVYYFKRPTQG